MLLVWGLAVTASPSKVASASDLKLLLNDFICEPSGLTSLIWQCKTNARLHEMVSTLISRSSELLVQTIDAITLKLL